MVSVGCGSSEATPVASVEPPPATPVATPSQAYRELDFIESQGSGRSFYLSPARDRDGIPAVLEPRFLPVEEANEQMDDDEMVMGLSINGEHHAYSVPFLSDHEVVNDVVGGKPVAVTW